MILVTGGAGYIGCVAVRQLLAKGEAVRVFDKLYFGADGLAEVADSVEIVQGDIRTFDPAVLDGCDAVLHLAGLSNDPTAEFNPKANEEMNTTGTEIVARAAKERGIRRFIFASTCSIYDLGFYAEDFLRDEESEVRPRAAYAVSNYNAERILLDMRASPYVDNRTIQRRLASSGARSFSSTRASAPSAREIPASAAATSFSTLFGSNWNSNSFAFRSST